MTELAAGYRRYECGVLHRDDRGRPVAICAAEAGTSHADHDDRDLVQPLTEAETAHTARVVGDLRRAVSLLMHAPDELGCWLAPQIYAGPDVQVRAKRYADLLRLRYFHDPPWSCRELGVLWGVGPQRVRQVESRLLRMLRHPRRRAVARAVAMASPRLEAAIFGHPSGYCECDECAGRGS